MDDWETTDCPLCGSADATLAYRVDHVAEAGRPAEIVRCGDCGLHRLAPRPTPAAIGRFYPEDYFCYRPREAGRKPKLKDRLEAAVLRAKFGHPGGDDSTGERLAAAIGPALMRRAITRSEWIAYRGAGRLLDVGCGAGDFLLRMKRRGWSPEGFDIGAEHAARIADATALPCHTGSLATVEPAAFDLVTFFQVLEHLHDPVATLREARALLTGAGSVVATVPNFGSWSRRAFGDGWVGLDPPRHLIHYTPATLAAVFEAAGFRVTRLAPVGMDGWVRRSSRQSPRGGWRRAFGCKPLAALTASVTQASGAADNILIEAVPDGAAAKKEISLAA